MMCGGHFVRMLVPAVTASVGQTTPIQDVKVIATHVPCPTCGAVIAPEFSWCPKCGSALRPRACSYCRQTVNPGDKTCSFCGAPPN